MQENRLELFEEQVADELSQRALLALERYFAAHKERLAELFVQSFEQLCLYIGGRQQRGLQGKLGHITYSLLRTELLAGSPLYMAEATDRTWYMDENSCYGSYDASWAFRDLAGLEQQLLAEARGYFSDSEAALQAEAVRLRTAVQAHRYVISLIRYAMPEAAKLKAYRELEKEVECEVRVGEYMDQSETVYKEDFCQKEAAEVRAYLEQKQELTYTYEVFAELDLAQGDYAGIQALYSDFRGSDLSHSSFEGAALVGAKLSLSKLTQASFRYTLLCEADFRGSELQGADFSYCSGPSGMRDPFVWEHPGFVPLRFNGADLSGADFTLANVKGASFIGANLAGAVFEQANIEQALFSASARSQAAFSEEQLAQAIWIEEDGGA
ncbi:pentapeptide repeat-containing protein [Paenibacillus sp. Leaf72]|uniref:pentapeptide repeat-containing protein n=1 Tax=Paenibacillus sp. Leaf72 TaxID=1736234 RepID=UPI0006F649E6|nr:pentapeptide repeat-containing protein [Paenibacillus sp. Leaf72]KQN96155.1 hypothetical protein ASF12_25390 [Paenibacillus sp. Leaf72]